MLGRSNPEPSVTSSLEPDMLRFEIDIHLTAETAGVILVEIESFISYVAESGQQRHAQTSTFLAKG